MELDQKRYLNEDLVLRVSTNVDPAGFDLTRFEPFIDALCGTREYQREAIATVLRYFIGHRYENLRQLAEENYNSSPALKGRYGSFSEMQRHLQLPDQLSCSVDLATATGKSYVMYGIARIMLALGVVDRVLVLCPSRTIERQLTDKFRKLSSDAALISLLPDDVVIRNPHIINATESIVDGTICIENFHATLEHVGSSIRDSLLGRGERTLILNDEVHHVYTPPNQQLRKWKEFLADPAFSFHYVAGFSGTCYTGNEYFCDVVTRFSLRQAIEQGYVKSIDYVAEDTSTSQDERFQKIYDNHWEHKTQTYRKVKPLTILVTQNVRTAKHLVLDLIEFLAQRESISREDAGKKVLIVTSALEHQINIPKLEDVDRIDSPVEWIVSVSMLTEGWDVQNVFQIVPHEERAFNSKLLIAQVLGRGLRIPEEYGRERVVVTVFNHDAWSTNIKHLVDEVMEHEKRVGSYPVHRRSIDFGFDIHQVDYSRTQELDEFTPQTDEYEFRKGYVSLASQVDAIESETVYARATTGTHRRKNTLLRYRMYPVEDVADHIHAKFQAIDTEEGTNYASRYGRDWLLELIRNSLHRVGEQNDFVSGENRQRLQKAFGVVHRAATQTIRYRMTPEVIRIVSTDDRRRDSAGLASFRRGDATLFYDELSQSLSDEETRLVIEDIIADESLPRSSVKEVQNSYLFKTPLNIVVTSHAPERNFVRLLVRQENAIALDGWIKSTDQDFYPIEYSWRKGEHAKRASFNPDFFIKQGDHIWVIEIKGDEERRAPSDENQAKFHAAHAHFEVISAMQSDVTYHFHFLTPAEFDKFFKFLRERNYDFVSEIDFTLEGGSL